MYDKTMCIFTMKNVCGWRDKKEFQHGEDPDHPFNSIGNAARNIKDKAGGDKPSPSTGDSGTGDTQV